MHREHRKKRKKGPQENRQELIQDLEESRQD